MRKRLPNIYKIASDLHINLIKRRKPVHKTREGHEIKIGETYSTRNGEKAIITGESGASVFPILGVVFGHKSITTWRNDGYCSLIKDLEHHHDLMRPWGETKPSEATGYRTIGGDEIKVGGSYITAEGSVVTVIGVERSGHYPITGTVNHNGATFSWTKDGRYLLSAGTHFLDLIVDCDNLRWKSIRPSVFNAMPPTSAVAKVKHTTCEGYEIEIGKTYMTRGGGKVKITNVTDISGLFPLEGILNGRKNYWDSTGFFHRNKAETSYDIMRPWVEKDKRIETTELLRCWYGTKEGIIGSVFAKTKDQILVYLRHYPDAKLMAITKGDATGFTEGEGLE